VLVTGKFPYTGQDNAALYSKIVKGQFRVPILIENSLKELLLRLLQVNPDKRPSTQEVINFFYHFRSSIVSG
jgi:serine/threonine protein kinase